jgi:hypothetical protein
MRTDLSGSPAISEDLQLPLEISRAFFGSRTEARDL